MGEKEERPQRVASFYFFIMPHIDSIAKNIQLLFNLLPKNTRRFLKHQPYLYFLRYTCNYGKIYSSNIGRELRAEKKSRPPRKVSGPFKLLD